MESANKKKMTLVALILMIFTSVFGFANIPRSFYLMGYSAIPWYILSAITFFIPYAFMMAEYGAAFKSEKGGIYSWMDKSVGPKYAFIGTFMWYASYVIWMVNISSSIWIPLSNAIFGSDKTATWSLLGLSSTQTLGLLGVCWILVVTITASKGLEKITKVTSVGGTAVALLNIVLLIGAVAVLVLNGGHLAQPVAASAAFTQSPNPSYQSTISILSFLVFALFAYGGIEAVGGLVDETENAEVTFPKGVTIAAIIIAIGYSLGIFLCGIFTNWQEVLSVKGVHMGNVAYVVMQNLGYQLGKGFGLSQAGALTMGAWMARYMGLSMFLALTGAFFTLCYAPLKQLIEGTPKELWPGKMAEIKDGMPKNAMWIQCIFVMVFILLVSFGGDAASKFFAILIEMTNVAMTLPYMFLSAAFIAFKKKESIKKPFEVFKNRTWVLVATVVVTFTIGFANFFTIIEPAVHGKIKDTIWMLAGPVIFSIIGLLIYGSYEKKKQKHLASRDV
ncbi:glutamate/gamma-aminobutyrate family transporter YjeM [Clostridium sp. JS66]|uniref:glutamate/gamma-aminobutyrate family transporter YjeM n=1 Tax=Clostridium sp. JS66 TaxID=3064705 RepID=UPI00298E07A9|nr:glutamate/gamma-aminobutyrate family transporter YjeM [Clostridium sp. JS66]WPC39319.1 glutamate/gamma-aminobutyrate family transporter YjeM [Clostridium sp. JS66]